MSPSGDQARRFKIQMDRSRAPRAFRDRHNLWQDDLERIYRLISRQVDALEQHRRQNDGSNRPAREVDNPHHEERPHLAVAVFGPSGSGKSSLIRTLADDVRRSRSSIMPENLNKRVVTLPVMNPTTWSPTDQFLYAFLAAALEEERNDQDRQEHGYPQGLSPVQLAFQEVNEYLRVVDEPEHSNEHDPLGLSLQKLERHTSGLRLRKALSHLIEELAKALRAEVVLLPVDDLDMAPDHLVGALQSYQSFLTHPRLVPVFTFTDRMPEELIEVFYKQQLGEAASHQRLGGTNRLSISEQMAVQFLARCFPVRNRVRLGPAPARVQRAIYSGGPAARGKEEPANAQVLELLVQASFLLFGNPDAEDSHKIRAALRPSTLRRQLQVVDAMADCRLWALRTPQYGAMAGLSAEEILEMATLRMADRDAFLLPNSQGAGPSAARRKEAKTQWGKWLEPGASRRRLAGEWASEALTLRGDTFDCGYHLLARSMRELKIGATWATVFNGAAWSLLNVHRDTLRELGLFLEDLYSWTPKELRSVVVENILAQDLVTRRTVVDRWFNRTDYRRSQVLSLLAANVFRPWMLGEEPYGDEETPIHEQIRLERDMRQGDEIRHTLDRETGASDRCTSSREQDEQSENKHKVEQVRERLTIPAPQGLLWFLNVTLGFYLPQIMARNWDRAMSSDIPVKSRMSGNGWDMHHAATNAIRIGDAKQEIFSFGMMFLHPLAYRRALEVPGEAPENWPSPTEIETEDPDRSIEQRGTDARSPEKMWRRHLLLRIWTSCGYSSGRYWSAFSLWRGLSFMGQILELSIQEPHHLDAVASMKEFGTALVAAEEKNTPTDDLQARLKRAKSSKKKLQQDIARLIRIHVLNGYVPGSLLNRNSDDNRLLHAFPRWDPGNSDVDDAIKQLADDLIDWLIACRNDLIFPLPAGGLWVGWKDCFIRRIHGEYILGGLWPRLNSAYIEKYERKPSWLVLAKNRAESASKDWKNIADPESPPDSEGDQEDLRWSASLAAGAWSDILLEYWKGCPPVLKLLLTCPVMFKSEPRFGATASDEKTFSQYLEKLEASVEPKREDAPRLAWLKSLGLPTAAWKALRELIKEKEALAPDQHLVPSELAIPRVKTQHFTAPGQTHHTVRLEPVQIDVESQPPAKENEEGEKGDQ